MLSIPIIWVKPEDKAWFVTSLLNRYLGSFTDSVAVMDSGHYVGVIDGRDLLSSLLKNPTNDFFQNSTAKDFMIEENLTVTPEIKISKLISMWEKNKRDYAFFKNSRENLSTISARMIADASALLCNDINISDIQKNKIITCSKDNTIGDILHLMLKEKIRRVFYDNYKSFVSDRTIIKKITTDLEFLNKVDKFLDLPVSQIGSNLPIAVDNDLPFSELIRIMSTKEQPCIIFQNTYVITYHDIVMSMKSFLV